MNKPYIVTGDCRVSATDNATVSVVVIAETPGQAKKLAGDFVSTTFEQGFTDSSKLIVETKSGNAEALLACVRH